MLRRWESLPDFMLGSIAPDAVNIGVGMAPQDVRYAAHIRSRDVAQWLRNIHEYRMAHEADYSERPDVFRGMLLHLFTDIAWDETVQPLLFSLMSAAGVKNSERSERKWDELAALETQIIGWESSLESLAALRKAVPCSVNICSCEQVAAWQQETLRQYSGEIALREGLLGTDSIFIAGKRAEELMLQEFSEEK